MQQKVLNKIDELFLEYVNVWKEFCELESPTADKEAVDKATEYIVDIARKYGFDIEYNYQEVSGNAVCLTLNPNAKGSPVCFSGHVDTVHEKGLFGYPATKIEGDKIYGPGVTDCKGGIIAALLAMVSLKENGFTDRPIRLILQSDEEVNSRFSKKETIKFMIEKSRDSVAFINLEPAQKDGVCINRKGIVTYTFTVKGISAHASLCAISGANAILEASYKIIEAEKLKDHNGITCNCGVISGGSVANTVPEECTFKANVRFFTKEQREWTDKFMLDIAKDVKVEGCVTSVAFGMGRPPMELTEKNIEFANRLNEIFTQNGMTELKPFIGTGGSDAAYITEEGIPCVDCLGVIGDRIHSADEYAEIESLREYAKRLSLIALFI